jgi:hypothetical protein
MNDEAPIDLPIAGWFPNNPNQQREPKPSNDPQSLRCQVIIDTVGRKCWRIKPPALDRCLYHLVRMKK